MTIKKFILTAWVVLIVTAAVLFLALYNLYSSYADMEAAYQSREVSQSLARELEASSLNLTRSVRQYAVTGSRRYLDTYWMIVKVRAGQAPRPADADVAPGRTAALTDIMKEAHFTKRELDLLQRATDLSNALIELETKAMNAVQGLFQDASGDYSVKGAPDKQLAAELVFSDDYNSKAAEIMEPIAQFRQELADRLEATVAGETGDFQLGLIVLVGVASVWLLMFIGFLIMVKRMIIGPTILCQRFAAAVAGGDLDNTLEYSSNHEIGELAAALRGMVQSLRERIQLAEQATRQAEEQSALAARAAADAQSAKDDADAKSRDMLTAATALEGVASVVSSASTELSAQIEQSERGAAEQAARISETATAMEEMNSTVIEVSRNASEAAKASAEARVLAEQGANVVKQTIGGIAAVQTRSRELKDDMTALGTHANSINQIMNVISDIADQTNLLALNAAIEAARAGDAGRGFAVVADEVRKLAENTMRATMDVGGVIKTIQESAQKSIQGVEGTVGDIETAAKLVVESGEALGQIVATVELAADQVRAIAAASEQQSATSEEINRSVVQVSVIANETSRAMEESARAVTDLAQQANTLAGLIEKMKRV